MNKPGKPIEEDRDFAHIYVGDTFYTEKLLSSGHLPVSYSGAGGTYVSPVTNAERQKNASTRQQRKLDQRQQRQEGLRGFPPRDGRDRSAGRSPHQKVLDEGDAGADAPAEPTTISRANTRGGEGAMRGPPQNLPRRKIPLEETQPSVIRSWEDGTKHVKLLWTHIATNFPETFRKHAISHVNKGGEMAQRLTMAAGQIAAAAAEAAGPAFSSGKSAEDPVAAAKRGDGRDKK